MPNSEFSSRGKNKSSLFDSLAMSPGNSPCDSAGRDHYYYYFHFIDEGTEAQRLACSVQLMTEPDLEPSLQVPGPHLVFLVK